MPLALAIAGALLFHTALLRTAVGLLIEEDSLQPAAAIVVVGGEAPFRALEAADLYRAGWAPRVVVSREAPLPNQVLLATMGIDSPSNWALSRAVLLRSGVPEEAIVAPATYVGATRDELQRVYETVRPGGKPVILVTTRIHTRRVGVIWRHTAADGSPGVVRVTHYDTFDRNRWWRDRGMMLAVNREIPSLINEVLAYPARDRP